MKAFLDIETSGLDPFKHEVIEVAYVRRNEAGKCDEHVFCVDFDQEAASPQALDVNQWPKRAKAGQIPRKLDHETAAKKIWTDLNQARLVGNSIDFDAAFLTHYLRKHLDGFIKAPWSHRLIELKALFAGRHGLDPELVSTSSIIKHLGIEPDGAHTALGDARWNMAVYDALGLYHA